MIKPDIPSPKIRLTSRGCSRMEESLRLKIVRFPVRKRNVHRADAAWEITVAMAAPRTPIPKTKMKIGSRMRFRIAPIRTVIMPVRPNPWELMKLFIPRPIMTNRLPHR